MRNKGPILTFTILLALACLYQLSFTWVANNVQSDAAAYAKGSIQKEEAYLDSVGNVSVYPVLGFTYNDVKKKQLNLGLDLKGGMNVVLQVSMKSVLQKLAANPKGEMFERTLAEADKMKQTSTKDYITLFVESFEKLYPNKKLVSLFYSLENKGSLSRTNSNEQVAKFLRKQGDEAIDGCFQVIRTRVRLFGVAQPDIQRLKATDRIMVELPGVKNQKRVRTLLQGTAKLEFWETYENSEVFKYVAKANTELGLILSGKALNDSTKADSAKVGSKNSVKIAANVKKDSSKAAKADTSNVVSQILGGGNQNDTSKADTGANATSKFNNKNPLFSVMRPNYVQQNGQLVPGAGPVVGYCAINDTSKVNKYLAMPKIKAIFPINLRLMWTAKPFDKAGKYLQLVAIKITNSSGKAPLEGNVITDASQEFDQQTGTPEIQMDMNAEGARIWKTLTGANIGRSIAIALDNKIYSFPTVQSEIGGGVSSITGNFTIDEAKTIANILKSGKLPAPAHIVQETIVGPSLGKASITHGLISFIIALIVAWLYMMFYYNRAGWIAVIALMCNLFFILGILASTNIALTLSGIAGIVLTIGMATDCNILIYERTKEELNAGKSMNLAIHEGFKMSYPAIIDGHVTTLLTGIILWVFGTGPIKGFAHTLVIGTACSLFSAIFITRFLVYYRLENKNKKIRFSTILTEKILKKANFKFMENRKYSYIFSGTVIIIAIISMFVRGFDYGIDFSGGRTYLVAFNHPVQTENVRSALADQFKDSKGNKMAPLVKTFGSNNQVMITTNYLINDNKKGVDDIVKSKLNAGLSQIGSHYKILQSRKVGPSVAQDIKKHAVWAVVIALIVMFIYIMSRFKGWQYGAGIVIALFHDTIFVLAFFSLFWGIFPFSLNIDQDFIAAILTVIGYSANDSVIIFDRIREYLGHKTSNRTSVQLIDDGINHTLSRTLNTSLITIFTLLMIFIFGGATIRGFIFALLIGIVVGTYSSIFVSAPIMLDFSRGKLGLEHEHHPNPKKGKAQTA